MVMSRRKPLLMVQGGELPFTKMGVVSDLISGKGDIPKRTQHLFLRDYVISGGQRVLTDGMLPKEKGVSKHE